MIYGPGTIILYSTDIGLVTGDYLASPVTDKASKLPGDATVSDDALTDTW